MFVELRELERTDDKNVLTLVNIDRIMWAQPLEDDTCRIYMNVANDDGKPASLDVDHTFDELKTILTQAKRSKS